MLWHWCFNASVDFFFFFFTPCNWKTSDLGILEHFKNTEWSSWHLQDLKSKPQYLVTFTVGYDQRMNIDTAVKKVSLSLSLSLSLSRFFFCVIMCVWLKMLFWQFSGNFTILLFHYDGRTTEWDEFEWSKQAIHVSVRKQTKW